MFCLSSGKCLVYFASILHVACLIICALTSDLHNSFRSVVYSASMYRVPMAWQRTRSKTLLLLGQDLQKRHATLQPAMQASEFTPHVAMLSFNLKARATLRQ